MEESGWVASSPDETGWPFSEFPNGAPSGSIACVWSADPNVGTDNVVTLAWAPIDAEAASAAQAGLETAGFDRISAPEGIYLAIKGDPGWVDAEGYGASYLFTVTDVRWAMFKDELRFIKAPDDVG